MKIYNSLTKKKEPFVSLSKSLVKIYVCGITPYDTTHLGHAFTYVFFDVVYRYLTYQGYNVTYTQNVTDIDDDILKKAQEVGKNWKELGDFWTNRFTTDMKSLNVLPPTHYIKATDSITMIIRIIKALMNKGFAYQIDENVYFSVEKDKKYGKLSRLSKKEMIILLKERGGDPNDPHKKNPLDFLLWQKSKDDEPYWKSPFGKGRPGWHIECSAMNFEYLGKQIDIHGGGYDLIYPHHESETAQSESFTGISPFVRYWLHTAMLKYQGQKMSKSLGNLVLVSDLLQKYSPNAIRYLLLSHHYRSSWEYKESELENAEKKVRKLLNTVSKSTNNSDLSKISAALDDDFNTPLALALLQKYPTYDLMSLLGFIL
ncbi:MAG: cysteine--tRNA ligase [Candidatus Levyibacteriota bacterium]|nr:MAG: cysteine--tRNA ligase [Candidatus Levybacteria bacterium]